MASNAPRQSPLQGFIEQYLQMRQFVEGQRQFGEQQALAQRQIENAEINQFAALAPFVEQPEQRQALAEQFSMRMPHMAETFAALAQTIPVSEQVYRARKVREGAGAVAPEEVAAVALTGQTRGALATSGAQASRAPEDIVLGLRTQEGQELTAGQEQQGNQFQQNLLETIRQFNIGSAQRDRSLGIQEFTVAQQGELARMSTLFGAGFGGYSLRAEQSRELREVQEQLQNPALRPEQRAQLRERAGELEAGISEMNNFIAGQLQRGGGGAAAGMNLNQLIEAEGQAYDDIGAATSPGEHEVAIQRFNYIRSLLRGAGGMPAARLEQDQNWLESLLGRPGGTRASSDPKDALTDDILRNLPLMAQPGGAQ